MDVPQRLFCWHFGDGAKHFSSRSRSSNKVLHQSQLPRLQQMTPSLVLLYYYYSCLYRIVIVFCVLLSLFCLLLSLQFDLHGVCDQGSEDGIGLSWLDEWMLKRRETKNEREKLNWWEAKGVNRYSIFLTGTHAHILAAEFNGSQLHWKSSLY